MKPCGKLFKLCDLGCTEHLDRSVAKALNKPYYGIIDIQVIDWHWKFPRMYNTVVDFINTLK